MKVRLDFVTNSSSTSYCCVGIDIDSFKRRSGLKRTDEFEAHLFCVNWDELEYGGADVGLSIECMKEDQTLRGFMEEAAATLNKHYGTDFTAGEMYLNHDGGYNG
jgi:hypothetical protein